MLRVFGTALLIFLGACGPKHLSMRQQEQAIEPFLGRWVVALEGSYGEQAQALASAFESPAPSIKELRAQGMGRQAIAMAKRVALARQRWGDDSERVQRMKDQLQTLGELQLEVATTELRLGVTSRRSEQRFWVVKPGKKGLLLELYGQGGARTRSWLRLDGGRLILAGQSTGDELVFVRPGAWASQRGE